MTAMATAAANVSTTIMHFEYYEGNRVCGLQWLPCFDLRRFALICLAGPGPQSLVPEQINARTDVGKCRVVYAFLFL